MVLQTWGDVIVASLQQVWASVANFVPLLIGAVVVFIIGWIIAVSLGKLVEQLVKALKVDMFLSKLDMERTLERAGWKLNSGGFLGGLVKWFLIVVFLLAAANILGLTQVSDFLRDVLLYIPNVVVAALILIIAALVSVTVERLVRGSVEAAGYKGALVAVVARWAIWVFAFVAALLQIGIATSLLQTVVTGLVAALALAFGLSFGLGGKDAATAVIDKIRGELRR
jgi:hypothetical protein